MNLKRNRRTVLFSLFLTVLAAVCSQPHSLRAEETGRAAPILDGRKYVKNFIQEKVGEPREIKRMPVFDNLPFLKLKTGDQLVKARRWMKSRKGSQPRFDENESYFILSDGQYHSLQWKVKEQGEKLVLESAYLSLLFDWDVSLANAKLLGDDFGNPITLKSLAALKNTLRKDFPRTLRDVGEVKIAAPYLAGIGRSKRAVFQGLGFDLYENTIFKYQFDVGNETYIQYRKNLVVGPRRVDRDEFEGVESHGNANAPAPYTPTPEAAAKAFFEYEQMKKFQAIVDKFLVKPLNGVDVYDF